VKSEGKESKKKERIKEMIKEQQSEALTYQKWSNVR